MMIAAHTRKSRIILAACALSASTYYWRAGAAVHTENRKRGRTRTLHTADTNGVLHDNRALLLAIERILAHEFACYGHRAMAAVLRREGFCINHKKLYRLM